MWANKKRSSVNNSQWLLTNCIPLMSREKAPQKKKEAIYIDAWRIEEVTKGGTIQTVQVGKKTQGTSRSE